MEEAREKIRELRSPSDQLRHKFDRERKLKVKADKFGESIKQDMLIVVEAEERLEALREQLHEAQEELQELASQKILLATPPGVPAAPMDLA